MMNNFWESIKRLFGAEKKKESDKAEKKSHDQFEEDIEPGKIEKIEKDAVVSDYSDKAEHRRGAIKEVKSELKEEKFINVGIDFGTSGTKIIYRDIIGKKAWVCGFDHGLREYPDFVLPSSIRVINGKLYFGGEAEKKAPQGNAIRSFKICMVCQHDPDLQNNCNLVVDHTVHLSPAEIKLPGNNGIYLSFCPCELGTIYLAYVIGIVRRKIEKQFGKGYDFKMTLNAAVPINFMENEEVETAFNESLFYANCMHEYVHNGADINDLYQTIKDLKISCPEIPGPEIRTTFVQPETITAVFSYVMSPVADEGLYGIADVGAGTTDVSFFRLSKFLNNKLSIYSAETHVVGANEIDSALLKWLIEQGYFSYDMSDNEKSELLQRLRILKQRMSVTKRLKLKLRSGECTIQSDNFDKIASPTGETIFSNYQKTWREAYKKEASSLRWQEYTLFQIGGGSKISVIKKQLSEEPSNIVEKIRIQELDIPFDLNYKDENIQDIEDNFGMLAIAYGLSFHPAMYPDITPPGSVSPFKPTLPIKDLPPWDQYLEQD